jgi:hypothetical protein
MLNNWASLACGSEHEQKSGDKAPHSKEQLVSKSTRSRSPADKMHDLYFVIDAQCYRGPLRTANDSLIEFDSNLFGLEI